jgi:hypothetical protein
VYKEGRKDEATAAVGKRKRKKEAPRSRTTKDELRGIFKKKMW